LIFENPPLAHFQEGGKSPYTKAEKTSAFVFRGRPGGTHYEFLLAGINPESRAGINSNTVALREK